MDINQTIPLLLTNSVRFLLKNGAKKGKIYGFILLLMLSVMAGFLLLYEFGAQRAEADLFIGEAFVPQESPKLVIFQGNTLAATANPFGEEFQFVKRVRVIVTAYSSTPWETDGSPYTTASGAWVEEGIIANNMLAFGTKVRMPELFGDKVFVVQDRMSWRKGDYHVDIWFPSYWEALNFGAKRTYIEILEV